MSSSYPVNPTPKTIQIFLPGGDPQGIRVAEITTRIVQVIEVPRSLLADFLAMPESAHVAVYFLVGETEAGEPQVYVGQTGDLRARLTMHQKQKEFWQRALVLISRTQSLTGTHTLFLEWHSLQAVRTAARYHDENGNGGTKPHTPAPLQADCLEIFETGRTLLATLGHPIFDAVASPKALPGPDDEFFCKASGVDARGLYTSEGFVVLRGSKARRAISPGLVGTAIGENLEARRRPLVESSVMTERDGHYLFEKDHLFTSPSAAAFVVIGRSSNGWLEWKTKDGRTLDVVKRQTPAP